MIDKPDYIKLLLKKYMERTASANEINILMAAWDLYDDEELEAMITEVEQVVSNEPLAEDKIDWAQLTQSIIQKAKEKQQAKRARVYEYVGWAAAFFIIAFGAVYFFWNKQFGANRGSLRSCNGLPANSDIPTNEYRCMLVLDSSQRIIIDSSRTGHIRRYGSIEVMQEKAGIVEYKAVPFSKPADSAQSKYHVISTPVSQQYQVILPGGIKIRLNSATVIRVPLSFADKRMIDVVKGEVYIECDKDDKSPLIINTKNAVLTGIASTFNVNAVFASTATAVVSGSLEVRDTAGHKTKLNRFDLSILARIKYKDGRVSDTIFVQRDVDIDPLLAWKKVNRVYDNVHLKNFVADMMVWYGLKIESLKCVPNTLISAQICYKAPVEEMLSVLEQNGIKVYRKGSMLTFCDPAINSKTARTAYLR